MGNRLLGELLRGERLSYDFNAGQRMGERRSLAQGEQRQWESCETGIGQPACYGRPAHGEAAALQHPLQASACRSCGLAELCRGHEEPVEATDLSATGRRTPTDQVRTRRRERSVPESYGESDRLPTGRLVPNGRSDQPRPSGGCPTGEGLTHSDRRTGPRTKDQRQLRRLCPRCLRRAYHSASAAFPRGQPGESESSSGRTRATGITHPGFYGRKPWEKPNSTLIINVPRPAKEGLRRPFPEPPPNRSQNLTTNPSHPRSA